MSFVLRGVSRDRLGFKVTPNFVRMKITPKLARSVTNAYLQSQAVSFCTAHKVLQGRVSKVQPRAQNITFGKASPIHGLTFPSKHTDFWKSPQSHPRLSMNVCHLYPSFSTVQRPDKAGWMLGTDTCTECHTRQSIRYPLIIFSIWTPGVWFMRCRSAQLGPTKPERCATIPCPSL